MPLIITRIRAVYRILVWMGLNDTDEQSKFASVVNQVKAVLSPQAATAFAADPSTDDYRYYQGPELDQARAGILERYSRYNGTEGNSKTAEQSQAELGLANIGIHFAARWRGY
jgi:cell surface protein SprA